MNYKRIDSQPMTLTEVFKDVEAFLKEKPRQNVVRIKDQNFLVMADLFWSKSDSGKSEGIVFQQVGLATSGYSPILYPDNDKCWVIEYSISRDQQG